MNTFRMKWRSVLALMMALVMVFGMLPNVALAEGSVTYLDSTGSEQTCESYTAITNSSTSLSGGWYYVDSDVTISDRITASGDVHLILGDGYTMTASAGITVEPGDSLTIYAQSAGSGSLVATGVSFTAAIGGNQAASGTITINGGNITATGGEYAAGIGGGNEGGSGMITINGGNITATGGDYGAGIGGGFYGGSLVTITGGNVTARGGFEGAGIGGGRYGYKNSDTIISITGGNITATGGEYAAGIGGGRMHNGGTISISGGTITATGGDSGAGIGGGRWSAAGNITITGGTIDAIAGADAADIGCGEGGGTIYVVTYKADGVVVDTQRVEEGRDTIVPAVPEKTGYTGAWDKDGKNITANTEINAVYTAISTGITYLDSTGSEQTCESYTAITDSSTSLSDGWYYLDSDVTISDRITASGDVHLILGDGYTMTASKGIAVQGSNSLTIYAQSTDDMGSLVATGEYELAAIGGGGTITINGGTIIAVGGSKAAGIGGGEDNSGGVITINGGDISATGGGDGAGIGGGIGGAAGTIRITGGNITATGGDDAPGIGAGTSGYRGTYLIEISGGTIVATGAEDGAGIGGGHSTGGGTITISGGDITARGGKNGAGIGGGINGSSGVISITGGTVDAEGGRFGAGIGSGRNGTNGSSDSITITASDVTATGGEGAEDIGNGAKVYAVTFDANGHGTAPAKLKEIVSGSKITAPTAPTADGYTFGGWYKEAACTNAWDFDVDTVTENITLYAKWTVAATYTVSFDRNGGFSGTMAPVTVSGEYTLPANGFQAWSGEYFRGWDVNGELKQPGEKITVTEDITIKAVWHSKDYNIKVGGVAITRDNAADVLGDGTVSYDLGTNTLTLNNANITGTAKGGTLRSALSTSNDKIIIHLVGNNTVSSFTPSGAEISSHNYAISGKTLTITGSGSLTVTAGDAESFSFGIAADDLTVGSECTITAVSGSSGFLMWALSVDTFTANGSTVLASKSNTGSPLASYYEPGMSGSKYVKIQPAYNVTVSFNANGGTDTMADETVVASKEYTLPECGFTAPEGQQFKAWSVNGSEKAAGSKVYPIEDITATAIWKTATYTVNYIADGVVVDTQSVEHGKDAVAPAVPAKEGYTGAWDHDGKNITQDTDINAVYTINTYTVKYIADGVVIDTQTVEHGGDAVAPEVPAKEGFTGVWDHDGKNITQDTDINAVYTAIPGVVTHTVTFMADGEVVDTQSVAHGEDAVMPEVPAKVGYTGEWDHDGKNITEDTTINAVYTIKFYTVKYIADGALVDTQRVAHGKNADVPTVPAKVGYSGAWDHDGKNITEDTEINAVYTAHTYTVTYKADGVVVDTQTVAYGKDAVAPEVPAKAGYTGVWDHDGKNITTDLVINAVYTAIPGVVTHTVTFKADGVIISTQTVEHGKDAVLPEVPAKTGYNGAWDHDGKNITEDTVINAVYTLKNINNIPDTGDHSGMLTWAMLLVLSSLGIVATVWFNKKRIVR